MKTILRILTLGIFMTALTIVSATSAFAQDVCTEIEAKQALYADFTKNYAGTLEQRKAAIQAGKQYVSKYGACAEDKEIVSYLNTNIPPMEKAIADEEGKAKKATLYSNFNTAAKGKNTADIFASGKEILAKEPDNIDVIITLANAGFDQSIANPPIDTYNNDVITYSKTAIEKIESGKKSEGYGVYTYGFKNEKFKDTKSNALGALNYNIGYIMYHRQGKDNPAKKKEALTYFYKATQYDSASKNDPTVYQAIGAWYLEEAIRLDTERNAKLKEAGNKDTEETLNLLGLQKGYADRAIDAYARAYKLASANTDPKNKAYKDALYTKLKELYAFRYDGKTEGIDAFVATVSTKPMPDPSTEVTPVKEAAPETTSTTSNTTSTTAKPSAVTSDTATAVQPSRNTTVNTTATKTADSANAAKPAATTKAVVKKPAPKKKGTR